MKILLPVFAGVVATLFMTLFTEIGFRTLKKNYHVVRILGNMLRFEKNTEIHLKPSPGFQMMALLIHYAVGVIFASLYSWVGEAGIIDITLGHGFLFGIVIGTIAILGWKLFFAVHPGPPLVELKYYLSIIWLGHIILGLVLFAMHQTYYPLEIVENIPLCR